MSLFQHRPHQDILSVFAREKETSHGFLRASAPMVRYSKLEFRKLVRLHGVKLSFTPMIIAESFMHSQKARENEFTTSIDDQPVIAQFAARNVQEFTAAAQLIYPYVDGIDLNCGCPQSWAIAKGYGAGLLRQPEIVRDIVQTVRRTLPSDFSISVKIRLLGGDTAQSTIDFARQLEKCGVTFLTLHGRNTWQRSSDSLNIAAMAEVKKSLRIPLIVNGNVRNWQDACDLYEETRADGIMAARGLLSNPTIFNPKYKGCPLTPLECLQQWVDIATSAGDNLQFQCFHHHSTFMWSCNMRKKMRQDFNKFNRREQILDFFNNLYNLKPSEQSFKEAINYTKCTYTHFTSETHNEPDIAVWNSSSSGKFFNEFNVEADNRKDDDINLEGSFFAEMN